ncbi:metallophosphoesterase [Roseinatronobacter alkalisoli]|uniref:Metallophosphoesterase n=1 Tax=Roseinatronobacter alkalisoli TaxID=3028235 RepID=A0ABT5T4N9_9RHOB|nr:metallophosphoesterase [Roseinatronobacter sp. HJB301]MDD7969964.1 metallophosphoesterase [Roseinatronobacter sp. HJB301]
MHKLAVIADPHYHEIFPGYRFEGVDFKGQSGACIRTRDDSAASTRVYNESYFSFPAALDACVAEGIETVVIAGDLTDDGQIATMDAALALLARYEAEHGIRFFLTPGNHDTYGMSGRHHSKAFYDGRGGTTLVTSEPEGIANTERVIVDRAMFCRSYRDTAPLWAPYGIQRRSSDLHWESPFGTDDAFASRMFEITSPDGSVVHRQLDLSYLVEPQKGLWLVSIDANVFEPRNGCADNTDPSSFADSTDAGWNSLVRLKPFILDWLVDVSTRAKAQGKTLICFSHYPVLDTYDGTFAQESMLFGATQAVRRTPDHATGRAVAATGIGVHFSGHLHVCDTCTTCIDGHTLTNHAIPSPVAFPPAFAVVSADGESRNVQYRQIEFDDFDAFFPFYHRDAAQSDWMQAQSYGDFLYRHVRQLVVQRHLPKEWPADLAQFIQAVGVNELIRIADIQRPLQAATYIPSRREQDEITGIDLITDWYAARNAGTLVTQFVSPQRLAIYRRLIECYAGRSWSTSDCLQSRLKMLLAMMDQYLADAMAISE